MAHASIFHLEPFPAFLRRIVELNRLHDPEADLHAAIFDADKGDGAAARKKLATLHRDFPYGAPVHEQAAYLLRGFVGLAPFDRANHRTGWDYTMELLLHHHKEPLPDAEAGRDLAADLWDRMEAAYPKGLSRKQVLDRDDTFRWLADWFRHRMA